MTPKSLTLIAIVALIWLGGPARGAEAQDVAYHSTIKADFSESLAALQEAVVNKGLVIDYTGMVGAMLARTGPDVGALTPYANAGYLQFCSAKLTHAAVSANPGNIALCPFVVFAYELKDSPGKTVLGYRRPYGADGQASRAAVQEIDKLLRSVVDDATQAAQ
ncbi:MAG: hypothetical protein ACRBC3_11345 [Burkholderiaceae bacterium]